MKANRMSALFILILTIGTIFSLYIPKNEPTAADSVVIPKEAIRLRILANSDSEKDQEIKHIVRDVINEEISTWVQDLTSMEEARALIQSRLPEIERLAAGVLKEQNVQQDVRVDFGMVQFPTKLYGEHLYPAGEYEAILVTIGDGKGANWWCVLFPPLCFLDFSNGTAISQGFEEEAKPKKAAKQKEKEPDAEEEPDTVKEEQQTEDGQVFESEYEPEKEDAEPPAPVEAEIQTIVNVEINGFENEERTEEITEEKNDEEIEEKNEENNIKEKEKDGKPQKKNKNKKEPLYIEEDDEVQVRFFIVELFQGIFK